MMSICENEVFMVSTHAATRMAQRGIRRAILDLVVLHGTPAKAQNDCEEYILSEQAARFLVNTGYDPQTITAATKVRAILDPCGTIVTCYHKRNGRARPSSRTSHLRDTRHI